jgi:hypothetical protein
VRGPTKLAFLFFIFHTAEANLRNAERMDVADQLPRRPARTNVESQKIKLCLQQPLLGLNISRREERPLDRLIPLQEPLQLDPFGVVRARREQGKRQHSGVPPRAPAPD